MFTGIVEDTGTVVEITPVAGGHRLRIETRLAPALAPGASLAVNGVCLTAVVIDGRQMVADVGPETARVTTLGTLQHGQTVNLERPLRVDGRLDGHFVLGHVDGVGVVSDRRADGDARWLTIQFPAPLAPLIVPRGSIAVDGVSLTVAGLGDREFDVMVVPYTWTHTALCHLRPGDKVNLECDMIGKHVVRALETRRS